MVHLTRDTSVSLINKECNWLVESGAKRWRGRRVVGSERRLDWRGIDFGLYLVSKLSTVWWTRFDIFIVPWPIE